MLTVASIKPGAAVRHIVAVAIAPSFIEHFAVKHYGASFVVGNEIPADARFLRMHLDQQRGVLLMFFEHESFPVLEDGTEPVEVTPTLTQWLCSCGDCEPCKVYREEHP